MWSTSMENTRPSWSEQARLGHRNTCVFISRVNDHQSCQFKALLFGQSTAPIEFTMVVKEVKLMAQNKGTRIYQYLDNCWSEPHPPCLSPAYLEPSSSVSGIRLHCKHGKVRTGTQTDLQVHRLPVQP